MRYKFVNAKSNLAFLLHPMDISYYAKRYLLKDSPVNGLAFVVCAKGEGEEMREKSASGKREAIVYPLSPTLPSLFPSSESSTTFDTYYKQAFFLALLYAGTC